MSDKMVHVYVGWAVTLPNGNVVNFTDQLNALKYFGEHGSEMVKTEKKVDCALTREVPRAFCGHCQASTYSLAVSA